MVLDLRLKEDWLSGDNQFLFYTYPILSPFFVLFSFIAQSSELLYICILAGCYS